MDDFERYGDYDEEESTELPSKNTAFFCIKILLFVAIGAVIALLGYRLFLFEYYPSDAKRPVMTDSLRAYCQSAGDAADIKTQDIRFPYDDIDLDTRNSNDLGTFFFDHLYVTEAIGQLQITARVNTAGLETIAGKYGAEGDADTVAKQLSFRLTDNYGRVYDACVYCEITSFAMYRYYTIVFDGIAFDSPADGLGAPEWIRAEILFDGEETPYSYALIYENNVDYNTFEQYRLSKGELA